MKISLLVVSLLILVTSNVSAQQPGDRVFVTAEVAELKEGKQVTGEVPRGQFLEVRSINQDWLWVNHLTGESAVKGWLRRSDVIPAEQVIDYLSQQLQQKPTADDFILRGQLWYQRNLYDIAVADFNEAIRIDPTSAVAWCSRGNCWAVQGEHNRAIVDYSEAIRIEPTYVCHLNNRANAWRKLGQIDKAIEDHNQAIRLSPTYVNAYIDRGVTWSTKKEYSKAIADFTTSIGLDNQLPLAFFNRGNALCQQGDNLQAISDFNEAIRLAPDASNFYNGRGEAWLGLGATDQAMADCDEAIRLDPNDAFPRNNRGILWATKGDYDKAIADYSAAIRMDPRDSTAYSNRGNAWLYKDEHALAIADYNEAIRLDPASAEPYLNRGTALNESGKALRAVADFSTAIRLQPDFALAYKARADVREKQGEHRGAVEDYERSLEIDNSNLAVTNSLAWLLATCPDEQIRDGERAVQVATRACELTDWQNWGPIDTLAAAVAEAGDFEEAVRLQTMARDMAPEAWQEEVVTRLALYRSEKPHRQGSVPTPDQNDVEVVAEQHVERVEPVAAKVQPTHADSPQAVYTAFQAATEKDDWSTATSLLSPESQSMMAGSLMLGASFMTWGDTDKEKGLEELLKKHGVDLDADSDRPADDEPSDPVAAMQALTSSIKDLPGFVGELQRWMHENGDGNQSGGFVELGELQDLSIDDQTASGTVETEMGPQAVEFRRVDGRWLLHLPLDGADREPEKSEYAFDDAESGRGKFDIAQFERENPAPEDVSFGVDDQFADEDAYDRFSNDESDAEFKPRVPSDDWVEQEIAESEDAATTTPGAPVSEATNPDPPAQSAAEPFEPFELLATVEASFLNIRAIAFSPDGRTYVTGGDTPTIWQIGSEEPLFEFDELFPLTGTVIEANAVAISPDGATLAIGASTNGELHLFDFATKELRQTIESHEEGVVSVVFSRDGKTVATSGYDGKAKLWNSETGKLIAVCEAEDGRGVHMDLTPDGKTLVTGGSDALLWSAKSGAKIGDLSLGEPRVMSVMAVDFSPDGKQIATGEATANFENAALIWSTKTRKLTATLKHELGVMSVAFSPDGKLLATASWDVKARIWRMADGKLVQTIEEDEWNSVDQVAWTHDGKALAVVSEGTIRFWGPKDSFRSATQPPADETAASNDAPPTTEPGVDSWVNPDTQEMTTADLPVPATTEMVTENIDLQDLPRIDGGDYQISQSTEVSYLAPVPLPEARDFYRQHLSADEWTEQQQSVSQLDTDERWLRVFEKEGFYLRLFLTKLPNSPQGQLIMVELLHMGNVDTRKLPMPVDANKNYETALWTSFTTAVDTDTVLETCRKQFENLGWKEQGLETNAYGRKLTFVQNAIKLQVDVRESGSNTGVFYDVSVFKR